MNLLCWDTCTETVSITLVKESRFFFEKKRHRFFEGGPANFLLPLIHEICEKANTKLTEINFLGAVRGPGSLTGIRIGLSAAYGLAYALKKPLRGETLFELWKEAAHDLHPHRSLCILVDTYGSCFATQFYDAQGLLVGEPTINTLLSLQEKIARNFSSTDKPLLVSGGFEKNISIFDNFLKISDFLPIEINTSLLLAKKIMNTNDYCSVKNYHLPPYYIQPPAINTQSSPPGGAF